jgi:nitroimidazol reductase NimA-like FMN-containing flavoprotein (pyridoxamine 5'-phosphate oxidase superfamily)
MPKLSQQEIEQMLERRRNHLRLATVDPEGWPSLVPLGFTYRDGTIYLTARAKNRWLANIRRDPRVCVSIDDLDYFRRKITVRGRAEIRFEPGQDDEWRDLRLPLRSDDWIGPTTLPDGTQEWSWSEAYTEMTHDEPRALVALELAASKVTTWRMPDVGEYLNENWSADYYHRPPKRFRITRLGSDPADWKVVEESTGAGSREGAG